MAQNGKSYATSADGVLREIHEGQILRTVSKNDFFNSKKYEQELTGWRNLHFLKI